MIEMNRAMAASIDAASDHEPLRRGVAAEGFDHFDTLYRRVRAQTPTDTERGLSVGMTSCSRRSGVTTLSIALAEAARRCGDDRVLLVDADLAGRTLTRRCGLSEAVGLTDLLADSDRLDDAIHRDETTGLSVMPSGLSGRLGGIGRDAVRASLAAMTERADLVVVDLPAAIDPSPCFELVGALDGVLMVLEAERVSGDVAVRVKSQLLAADARLLGVVLNKRRYHIPTWLYERTR